MPIAAVKLGTAAVGAAAAVAVGLPSPGVNGTSCMSASSSS